ncbi:MAG: EAL domain-containing protein, partial [Undibacterium sp.]|nr:EAL domain-containing protein [Undibacterium sp.]
VEQVLAILELTGANPHLLRLEITEGFSHTNIDDAIAKMMILKDRGIRFSLDNFGTGSSTLPHLKRLPIDQLKIDRSFVREVLTDPNSAAICKMVIALAESLHISTLAGGVETAAQQAHLAQLGCRTYQGFLYSEALMVAEFEDFAKQYG